MKYYYWIFLVCIIGIALWARLAGWLNVFPNGVGQQPILLREVDSYYHLRLIENMMANFPNSLKFDQFATLGGLDVGYPPLMSWIVVGTVKVLSIFQLQIGPNVEYLASLILCILPVIIGTLCILLIFLLGKTLHSIGAGLIAALLASTLPSELLHRSLLGYGDHHILEVFFLLGTLYSVIKLQKDKNLLWFIPAGLSIGLYNLNWQGGLFIVELLLFWIAIQFLLDYFKYNKLETITYIGLSFSLVLGFIIVLPWFIYMNNLTLTSYLPLIVAVIPIILLAISRIDKKLVVITILSLALISLVGFLYARPEIATWALNSTLAIFWGFGASIQEAMPTDFLAAFASFGIAFIFAGIGIWFNRKTLNIPFIVFTVILCLAMVGQRRWIYYGTIPIVVFTGISVIELSKAFIPKVKSAIVLVCIVFLSLIPIKGSLGVIFLPPDTPYPWFECLTWLRNNSPEPYNDTGAYYKLNLKEEPNYTVLTWWDYGHWLIEISRRVPLTSPTWQIIAGGPECQFLYKPLPESKKYLKGLKVKYVIVDYDMVYRKFPAIVQRYSPTMSDEDTFGFWKDSAVKALWEGEPQGFKLIHQFNTVKVFEVIE